VDTLNGNIALYGLYCLAEARGEEDRARGLMGTILARDDFYIGFGYLAAYYEAMRLGIVPTTR